MTDSRPLAGLAVAVTRPAGQGDALVQAFARLGATVTAIPLLAIEPLTDPAASARIDQQLQQLARCDFAIFISQNAAGQLLQALAQRQLAWPASLPAYAVGSATTAFLASHGIAARHPDRMDSEGLLALPPMQAVNGQRGLIFRGCGGRETLARALRERGATVDYCELYRRTLPAEAGTQWQDWCSRQGPHRALVCLNSSETLQNLLAVDHSAPARDNLTLLVPGERVARAATAVGFTRLCVARDATDASTLDTAIHWYLS